MKLILVRHGETDWNKAQRFQGQANMALNKTGRRQAAALAAALRQAEVNAILASDLQRAQETAHPIAAVFGLPVQLEPRVREMAFGAWEGLSYSQIQQQFPDGLAAWQEDALHVSPPGGETLMQVTERVQAALSDLADTYRDRTVVLVTHGGPLRLLLCLALGLAPQAHWRFALDLASLSELQLYDEDVMLTRLNDTHHLK